MVRDRFYVYLSFPFFSLNIHVCMYLCVLYINCICDQNIVHIVICFFVQVLRFFAVTSEVVVNGTCFIGSRF
jgi:hypothetical protein